MESALWFFHTFLISFSNFSTFSLVLQFDVFILVLDMPYNIAWPYTFGMYKMSKEYSK